MTKIIIGIDPDLDKSGVAVLGKSQFELKNLNFAEVIELFQAEQDLIKKVVIEAGWQGRTNQEQRDAGMLIWGMWV